MFEQITEQYQKSMKPMSELADINAKVCEQLLQKQTGLITRMIKGYVNYAQSAGHPDDVSGVMEAQKAYVESLQDNIVTTAKDTYAVITEAQEKVGELMKDAFTEAKESVADVTSKASKASLKTTAATNLKVFEQLMKQQADWLTGMVKDSASFAQSLGRHEDMSGVMEAQKEYTENLQEKMVNTAKNTYAVMSEAQEKVGEMMKSAFTEANKSAVDVRAKAAKSTTKTSAATNK
ncbi:phasin family protein [Endozoicomonas sp. SCSIO W0465]|uniref:phasin family protein n=1 Tax=Endozoicomonas TaxID=305899 RepID=UPI002074C63E|nr:phasin family protein [Endozoicomonas sp. SCSIO W0465]USE37971.1 phasin family protein [Endozoicomonas sp. SCSIO W0465]